MKIVNRRLNATRLERSFYSNPNKVLRNVKEFSIGIENAPFYLTDLDVEVWVYLEINHVEVHATRVYPTILDNNFVWTYQPITDLKQAKAARIQVHITKETEDDRLMVWHSNTLDMRIDHN